jgi:hypothetical protein
LVIKDSGLRHAWETEAVLRQPADFRRNLRLLEAMYEEARRATTKPPDDPSSN